MKYDYIIWDFNGTIFDDVQIDIDSLNELLIRRGLPLVKDREEYKEGFMFPIKQWYVNRGFDLEKESFDDVAVEWLNEYLSREPEADLVDGVAESLEFFKSKNVKQVIISASEISMLRRQLKMLGGGKGGGGGSAQKASRCDIAFPWRYRSRLFCCRSNRRGLRACR